MIIDNRVARNSWSKGRDMGLTKGVTRQVLADQIKEWLLQEILDGRRPLHSRLIELEIARQVGTSQAPVREALRGLEALGVVEITPFKGARVRHPSEKEILDAYLVRSELEVLGSRLAVERATESDLERLEGFVLDMRRAAAIGDARGVALADSDFHAYIVTLSGNSVLERVWRGLEPFSRTLITLILPGADPRWTAALHDPILAALRERDYERAALAIRHHFLEAREMAERLWRDGSTAPVPGLSDAPIAANS
jgi:DNA-binding GntR family transcriptional regulator